MLLDAEGGSWFLRNRDSPVGRENYSTWSA